MEMSKSLTDLSVPSRENHLTWNEHITPSRGDPSLENLPMVSVIISVHNGEAFLREAIDSILGQTMADFELLIADDASSDATRQIISGYNDSRLRLICNDSNLGLTRTLNKLIKMARGRFIARMDHDDVCTLDRFEIQVKFLLDHPDHDAVGSWAVYIDDNSREAGILQLPQSHEAILAYLQISNCMIHPSAMVRREAFLALEGYTESLPYSQDYDLWLRMVERGRIANIGTPLIKYRIHQGQISNSKLAAQSDCAQQALEAYQRRTMIQAGVPNTLITLKLAIRRLSANTGTAGFLLLDHAHRALASENYGNAVTFSLMAFRASPLSLGPWKIMLKILLRKVKFSSLA